MALGRALARSFVEHHPEVPFVLLLADRLDGSPDSRGEPFGLLEMDALRIRDQERLCFRYPQEALSYACTPLLLLHLLDRGFDRVLFFKQESLVLHRVDDALERLGRCSVLLTPHLVVPPGGPDAADRERSILLSGVHNVGFVGLSESAEARRMLSWWAERTASHCLHATADGMHFEQRWLDLAPSYFEGVELLRDPAYNVAHWNLRERRIEVRDGAVLVEGRPCRLFRFSGFEPERPDRPTRYYDRPRMDEIADASKVFALYLERLEEAGYGAGRSRPYAWDAFDNGVPIPGVAREIFRAFEAEGRIFERPFDSRDPRGFFAWLRAPAQTGPDGLALVSNLWLEIWRRRPDVREVFPDPLGASRDGFLAWTRDYGIHEHSIPEALSFS